MLKKSYGSDNTCNIDLKSLNDNRFGTSSLYQKRLAGSNDMAYQTISDMSLFKALTGGDNIMCEFKNKDFFSFLYKGVLWFNCNKLPLFGGDKGDWVYDRILLIHCGNSIPENERDPHIFEKIWEEKNSIINLALKHLRKLIDNNFKFDLPKDTIRRLEAFKVRNNTLLSFIEECCEVNLQGFEVNRTKKNDFKKIYYRWCDVNNYGKGKLKLHDIEEILETKFAETYVIRDGYKYLKNVRVIYKEKEDLGFYD